MAEKLKIPVQGMHCASCVLNVEHSLQKMEPIKEVKVSLDEQAAYIEIENGNLKAVDIIEQIQKSGYEVPVKEIAVKVKGMHCAACVLNVENALKKIPVVLDARVNLDEEKAYIRIIPTEDIENLLSQAITKSGYEYAGIVTDESISDDLEDKIEEELRQKKRRILVSLPAGLLLMLGNHLQIVPLLQNAYIQFLIAVPVFFYAASPILKAGWRALRHGNLNMDVMYSMGMLVAFISSLLATFTPVLDNHFLFYDTSVLLAAFLTIGRFLETRAKGKTSSAIKALSRLQPNVSHRIATQPLQIQILISPQCPHLEETKINLIEALSLLGIQNEINVNILEETQQIPEVFSGSPTILIDGKDIFNSSVEVNQEKNGHFCRVFKKDGTNYFAPTVEMLVERLLTVFETTDVNTSDVKVGDILLIKPGEKIPVDGICIAGNTEINESMITGEPMPVLKKVGDPVIAGTVNLNKPFYMKAEKVGSETVLSQIIAMVKHAQMTRPPIQKLADRLVTYFIPVVLFIAIMTFIIWYVIVGKSFLFSLTTFISILVIACPCALGLATPTALTVGLGKAAELGILIKNAEVLELAKQIDTIILDKTGTITEGKPEVVRAEWRIENPEIKGILFSMENNSNHPLAGAVIDYLEKDSFEKHILLEDMEEIPGQGLIAWFNGKKYGVGNEKLMNALGIKVEPELKKLTEKGKTIIYFASENQILAIFEIADRIKMDSVSAIKLMKKEGYRVVMLTGDRKEAAEMLASELGIEVIAEMKPEDKLNVIKSYQQDGKKVAFVGDGINDAPALTQSEIGIAIGAGTDIARESGDMVLIRNSLMDAIVALDLGKKVLNRIKYNLFWAVAYNFSLIPIAAGYLYPVWKIMFRPELAGLAMAMSSVSVVTLSLLLKRYKPDFNSLEN